RVHPDPTGRRHFPKRLPEPERLLSHGRVSVRMVDSRGSGALQHEIAQPITALNRPEGQAPVKYLLATFSSRLTRTSPPLARVGQGPGRVPASTLPSLSPFSS